MENTKKELTQEEIEATAKVKMLTEKLRFRLKESLAQQGDSKAFLEWLHSDDGYGDNGGKQH